MPARDLDREKLDKEFSKITGELIRELRHKYNYSQEEVADLVRIDVSKLSRVEAGERMLNFREGLAICDILQINAHDLFIIRPQKLTSS